MNDKSNIIKFPGSRTETTRPYQDDDPLGFEDWEEYHELFDKEDFPGLVQYCQKKAEQAPTDLYAQTYLGDAYVLNGEYEKAIEFLAEHHRKHPWNEDYQYLILHALFALGKNENDFDWTEQPVILRMSAEILDTCYEFLRLKRKSRPISELHGKFILKGYLVFTEEDLLESLIEDERFTVEDLDDGPFFAKVKVVRKCR